MTPYRPKTVLITGASSGIGSACALELAHRGYLVFAGVRSPDAGRRLAAKAPRNITPVPLDITCIDQVRAAVHVVSRFCPAPRGLDALVNNAGITVPGALELVSLDDLRRQLEVNVLGHVAVTQAFLPLVRRVRGRIVNVGSIMGRLVMPLSGPYAMSKFALRGVTDAWRRELLAWKIHVVLIEPGSVVSAIWDKIDAEAEQYKQRLNDEQRERYRGIEDRMVRIWRRARRMAVPAEAVARVVRKSIEARHPRPHRLVGPDAHLLGAAARFLPDSWLDLAIAKLVGGKK